MRHFRQACRVLLVTLVGSGVLVVTAGTAGAAQRGAFHFQPVSVAGTTATGVGKGPFTTDYPTGIDIVKPPAPKDPKRASIGTAAVDDANFKVSDWGSIGAENGSFIRNDSTKPICKVTITSKNGDTFDPKSTAGGNWTVTVDNTAKPPTITFEAKKPADCIAPGNWFWTKVPESPQPGDPKNPPTLTGVLALAEPATGETVVAVAPAGPEPAAVATEPAAAAPAGPMTTTEAVASVPRSLAAA